MQEERINGLNRQIVEMAKKDSIDTSPRKKASTKTLASSRAKNDKSPPIALDSYERVAVVDEMDVLASVVPDVVISTRSPAKRKNSTSPQETITKKAKACCSKSNGEPDSKDNEGSNTRVLRSRIIPPKRYVK